MSVLSVYHLVVPYPKVPYQIGGTVLEAVNVMRDLGVLISSDLKWKSHCAQAVNKAMMRVNSIFRCFETKSVDFLIRMYKAFVLPLLEYACSVWSPNLLGDIDLIESVQRNFTRRIPHVAALNLSYPGRLKYMYLKMDPLEMRRLKIDLVLTYKIIFGHVDVDFHSFFKFTPRTLQNPTQMRTHHLTLHKP